MTVSFKTKFALKLFSPTTELLKENDDEKNSIHQNRKVIKTYNPILLQKQYI